MKTPNTSNIHPCPKPKNPSQDGFQRAAGDREVVVMKFGGTSVADINTLEMMDRVLSQEGDRACVVILSALAGTTDGLVQLCSALKAGKPEAVREAKVRIEQIYIRFLEAWNLPELGMCFQARWQIFERKIQMHLKHLPKTLTAADQDELLVFGERLTTEIYALLFKNRNKDVSLVHARDWMVTDRQFGQARPLACESRAKIQQHILPLLKPGRVVITQGFTGVTPEGETTTIGRGGSDFSATFLAAQIKAERVIIWTDTQGLLSADPRHVPSARTLLSLTYDQAESLACNGAKVLHYRAILPLKSAAVPLEIRSTFQPAGQVSRISECASPSEEIFSLGLKPVHPSAGAEEDVFPCRHLLDIPLDDNRFGQDSRRRHSRLENSEGVLTYRQWAGQLPVANQPCEGPDFVNVCLFYPGLKKYPMLCKHAALMLQNHDVPTYFTAVSENAEFALLMVSFHHGDKALALLHEYLTELTTPSNLATKTAPALLVAH